MTHDHSYEERHIDFIILHNSQNFFGIVRHSNSNIRNEWFSCNFCLFKILLKLMDLLFVSLFYIFCIRTAQMHTFNTCSNMQQANLGAVYYQHNAI